jgi:hypothetical protein
MNIIINTENKRENKTKEKEDKESQDIEDNETIVTHLNDYFKVPLYYNKEKVQLKKNIIQDLELVQTIDSSTNPIYSYYFNTVPSETNAVSTKITEQISEYYTTDVKYLKETQKLLKNYQLPKTRYTTYKNIIDITRSATAFLQNGKAPPNTPKYLQKKMEETNHLSSKKFFIIFTSVLMLGTLYYSSVAILLVIMVPEHVAAFVTLFTKTTEIFAVIVASYLGVQAAVDLRYNSQSNAEQEIIVERKDIVLTHNAKEDDYDISEVQV